MVPQNTHPAFDYTVLELALMGRYPHLGAFEVESQADLAIAHEALAATGTEEFATRLVLDAERRRAAARRHRVGAGAAGRAAAARRAHGVARSGLPAGDRGPAARAAPATRDRPGAVDARPQPGRLGVRHAGAAARRRGRGGRRHRRRPHAARPSRRCTASTPTCGFTTPPVTWWSCRSAEPTVTIESGSRSGRRIRGPHRAA